MDLPFYPVQEFGPVMKGLIIGGLGILHVFLAQFAIGGGMLMTAFQWRKMRSADDRERDILETFLTGYFRFLVLISFVTGALTGVGMWFTSIQISPRTIGMMVDHFHWVWATEWMFFWVEVVAGYAFYRYAHVLSDRVRLRLLAVYSLAAWGSLFWINGILSWQLTPGGWLVEPSVWRGFFNATFWPSLLFRTAACLVTAAIVAMVLVNTIPLSRADRERLVTRSARLMAPILAMPFFAVWFFLAMPDDSRAWATGGSPAITLFATMAAVATVLVAGYGVVALIRQRLYVNGATATLLLALAFLATAMGEFVREGSRKPYTVREVLYSNSLTPVEVAHLRERGLDGLDPYPLRNAEAVPTAELRHGAIVYRLLCSVCHTPGGVNGLTHLTAAWGPEQIRLNVARLQHTKTFMPPFAGDAEDLEALTQWILWSNRGRPSAWTAVAQDPELLPRLEAYLADAGVERAPAVREEAER